MFLSSMRTGVFSGIFLGILVLGGVGLILSDRGNFFHNGFSKTDVIEIDGHPIKTAEFDHIVRRALQRQGVTATDAYKAGLIDRIVQNEVMTRLLRIAAYDLGIIADDRTVADELKKQLVFVTGPEGDTKAALARVLQQQGMSEGALVESIRNDLSTNLLRNTIGGGVYVPQAMSHAFYEWNLEERTISYVTLPYAAAKVDAPTDIQLAKFYETVKADYTIPESRDITVAIVDLNQLTPAGKAKSDSDDDAQYEIVTQIENRLSDGEEPKAMADEYKMKLISVKDIKAGATENAALKEFGKDQAKMLQAAFSTNEKESSPLSDMTNGKMFTIHVDAVNPSKAKDIKDVKADLTVKWTELEKRRKSMVAALDITKKLDDKKSSIADIAKENGAAVKTAKVVRGNMPPAGFNAQGVGQIMTSDTTKAIAIPDKDGIQVVTIDKVTLPEKTPSASELANIEKNLGLDLQEERFVSFINNIERSSKVVVNKDLIDRMYGQAATEQE